MAGGAVGVDVWVISVSCGEHRIDVDTQLKFGVVWCPLLTKLTGDLCRPPPGSLRFRANGSHPIAGADAAVAAMKS